jgi:hypothetical protein
MDMGQPSLPADPPAEAAVARRSRETASSLTTDPSTAAPRDHIGYVRVPYVRIPRLRTEYVSIRYVRMVG